MSVFAVLHGEGNGTGFRKVRWHVLEACRAFLYRDCGYVLHGLQMAHGNTVMPIILRCSYGTHVLDHLATDGAGFPGGQVAVIAVGQVNADLPWCTYYIVNSSDNSDSVGVALPGSNSRTGSLTISPMNL